MKRSFAIEEAAGPGTRPRWMDGWIGEGAYIRARVMMSGRRPVIGCGRKEGDGAGGRPLVVPMNTMVRRPKFVQTRTESISGL